MTSKLTQEPWGPHPLNPDAGQMPMPTEPLELEAALRAGRVSLRLWPYYTFRYGERGARFTASDSAFLATLPSYPGAFVQKQIEWLGSTLSNRGMPTILLEQHLHVLSRQLQRLIPSRKAEFQRLDASAVALRARREAVLSPRRTRGLVEVFPLEAGLPTTRLSLGTAWLLVAAVADERTGIVNAVSSIETFFLNEALFPARFVAAARSMLERAKKA